ncbi:MAG TPA: C25 family cysteine peptidase, partial [Bacteroidia bacterium]
APAIATGRIAASNDSVVLDYLDKVILHESQQPGQQWQKNALHFIGGINAYEQSIFNSYMEHNKHIFEDTLIGGKVYTFKKTSTAPIAINTNDSIKQVIEAGVSLITFFGHGSVAGFEQNIDEPYNYENSPRFPLLISNSCYTGDIHTDVYSTSEKFVLADDHGTIGFLASVSTGVSYALQTYTEEYYNNLSYKNYGGTFGRSIQETIKTIEVIPASINDPILKITCLEMTLHGDPAITQTVNRKPDFDIANNDVTIDTESQADYINVKVDFRNLGKVVTDSVIVYIERTLPSGGVETYFKTVMAPYYATSFSIDISKNVANSVGLNKFYVKLDYFNDIDESNEQNNATIGQISAFVRGGDIFPVYPYEYSVLPVLSTVTLKASTADPLAPMHTYRIQVDTSDAYSNPILNTTITSVGGVLSVPVGLYNLDSMVYFWRIGRDSSNVNAINWRESTFQTIANKSGWGQSHFHQFKNDEFEFVSYNKPLRKFEFKNNIRTVFCRTGWVADPMVPPFTLHFSENSYYFDNAQQNYWTCGNGVGWSFAIFDPISGVPEMADTITPAVPADTWLSQYNSCVCTPQLRAVFDFGLYNKCKDFELDMPMYMQRMEDFLNAVPNDSYVLAYSHNNDSVHAFTPSLLQAFTKIGSDSIQFKKDTCQMIIFGQKKSLPHTGAKEAMGKLITDIVTLSDTFSTKWTNGFIASEIIGPAAQWKSLHWRYMSDETPSTDNIYLKIFGIKSNGVKDTVPLAVFPKDSMDVYNLQNYVNVNNYPYLQLVVYEADYINHTAPQLKRWHVMYDEVPEAAINPTANYSVNKPSISEGDNLIVTLPIKNISAMPFTDSLVVTYWLEDAAGIEHPLPSKMKYKPFMPDDIIIDTITVNTLGYQG